MGGPPVSAKYVIIVNLEVDGVIDKSDVIGAIFGQTEGLLGDDLELRELQKTGKVGRIEVNSETRGGKTYGEIVIPTNLDKPEVALIAAAIETIDKIGPSNAKITLKKIIDQREEKRKKILERAREILTKWKEESGVETKELIEEIISSLKTAEMTTYGPEKLPAGPDIDNANEIIIVEGRADVLNLLKHGFTNVIALGGATVPDTIIELSKKKAVTVFVDGDRGGELILRRLIQVAKVDYVARAPPGREVEELSGKEIVKALNGKITLEEFLEQLKKQPEKEEIIEKKEETPEKVEEKKVDKEEAIVKPTLPQLPSQLVETVKTLMGTMEGAFLNKDWIQVDRFPVKDVIDKLSNASDIQAIIIDGVITQRLVDLANEKKVQYIVGYRVGNLVRRPVNLKIYTFETLLSSVL
ncbi:MAG: DNA primase DnaG [Thermoprotei archaeon]|jgi:DNA primase